MNQQNFILPATHRYHIPFDDHDSFGHGRVGKLEEGKGNKSLFGGGGRGG